MPFLLPPPPADNELDGAPKSLGRPTPPTFGRGNRKAGLLWEGEGSECAQLKD